MRLDSLQNQAWSITLLQAGLFYLVGRIASAAIFARPARRFRLFRLFLRSLCNILVILLLLIFVFLLQVCRWNQPQPGANVHPFSLHLPSFFRANPEQWGDCFNFKSRQMDYYEVLGLHRDVPKELIRPAYKAIGRACHPDKLKGVSWEAANANAAVLTSALETLRCDELRCEYDFDLLLADPFGSTVGQIKRCAKCVWNLASNFEQSGAPTKKEEKDKPAPRQGNKQQRDTFEEKPSFYVVLTIVVRHARRCFAGFRALGQIALNAVRKVLLLR